MNQSAGKVSGAPPNYALERAAAIMLCKGLSHSLNQGDITCHSCFEMSFQSP
jgi:hypothetical protein